MRSAAGSVSGSAGRSRPPRQPSVTTSPVSAHATAHPRRSRPRVTRPRAGAEEPELALQAIDLFRLFRLPQRLLVDADRLTRLADLLVGVAEMLGDRRV